MATSMKKKFTTDDIKSGYVVKLRNGDLTFVLRAGNFDKILCYDNGLWRLMSGFDKNTLKRADLNDYGNDIMEVYGLVEYGYFSEAVIADTEHRPLLWKRSEPVKMTVEEISKKLGYDVEIVASK